MKHITVELGFNVCRYKRVSL